MSELDPVHWLESHVTGFGHLEGGERSTIYAFALLWSLFEERGLGCDGCAANIVWLTRELLRLGRLDLAGFQEPLVYFKARYFVNNCVSPSLQSLRFRDRDRQSLVRSVIEGDTAAGYEVAAAVLIIVFRLRNNFLHGDKWAGGLHGQIANFSHANAALIAILECIGADRFNPTEP